MKVILVIFGIVAAVFLGMLGFYGYFNSVEITEREVGPYVLVYQNHQGEYAKAGRAMDDLIKRIKASDQVSPTYGFGIYYDSPKDVKREELRSIVGGIFEGLSPAQLAKLKEHYKVAEYPKSRGFYGEFPIRGMLSFVFGPMKVYSAMGKRLKEKNLSLSPALEIYDMRSAKTVYFMPTDISVAKLSEFLN